MVADASAGFHIDVQGLGKRFNREWIFKSLSTSFSSGSPIVITGPNGSGKSTLLQVLWGQVPPTAGALLYKHGLQEIPIEISFKHISVAAPYMDLVDEFTLTEQMKFHFSIKSSRNGLSISDMMNKMELSHAKDKFINNFSSGMRQRVKLALAFFSDTNFIFLDEPGTNLDRKAFQWYRDHLDMLPPSAVIFIASNNPEEYPQNARIIQITDYKK